MSMKSNKSLQATAAAPSVIDGAGDSLLPGFVEVQFPAAVAEIVRQGDFGRMTNDELIAKARAHMKPLDRRNALGVSSDVFTEARVRDAALVCLGSRERDDYIEVYLDSQTGELITATYRPGSSRKTGGETKDDA
jgi:hypothetical protein